MDKIKIRLARPEDVDRVYEIEKENLDAWSYNILKQDMLENSYSQYLVAEFGENVVGYIGLMNIAGEIHINNICVDEKYRGMGIGEKLLVHGLNYYSKDGLIGYTLEVREDNLPAINLYKKFGFNSVGTRKNYYKNNKSAYIMWKLVEEIE